MPNTFTKIAETTVGAGGAASIDFTSIPGTYTDLQIVVSARDTNNTTDTDLRLTLNGSTGTFAWRYLYGSGSSASSGNLSGYIFTNVGVVTNATMTSNTFGNTTIYIPNYTSSTNKSISVDSVSENNATNAQQMINAILYSTSSAITQISVASKFGNFVQYSQATLYGILKGSGGATVS